MTANGADFKELVPEFFMPGDGAFLVNRHCLALGTRQNGCVWQGLEPRCRARAESERRSVLRVPFTC